MHLFCYLVHVTNIRSLIGIGVYAHADQLPQLKDRKTGMQTRKLLGSVLPGKGFGAVWALGCRAGARSPCTHRWAWADCRADMQTFVAPPLLPHGRTRETLFHQTISTGALIHTPQWILCHLQCPASIHTLGGFAVHCSETSHSSRGPSSHLAAPSLLTLWVSEL